MRFFQLLKQSGVPLVITSVILFSLLSVLPTTYATPFTVDISSSINWISSSSIGLDHDTIGNVFFSGLTSVTTITDTGFPRLDGLEMGDITVSFPATQIAYFPQFRPPGHRSGMRLGIKTNTDGSFIISATEFRGCCGQPGLGLFHRVDSSTPPLTHVSSAVPEPASILLFGTGFLVLAGYRWHQRRHEGDKSGNSLSTHRHHRDWSTPTAVDP